MTVYVANWLIKTFSTLLKHRMKHLNQSSIGRHTYHILTTSGSWLAIVAVVGVVSYLNVSGDQSPAHTQNTERAITGGARSQLASVNKASLAEYLKEQNQESIPQGPAVLQGQQMSSRSQEQSTPQVRKYTVKDGETLTSIAQDFHLSEDTLVAVNNLSSPEDIAPGDELDILPKDGVVKDISSDKDLQNIADTYEVDVEAIRDYNDLKDKKIAQTKEVIVPGADIPYSELPHKEAPQIRTASQSGYTEPAQVSANKGRNLDDYFALPAAGRVKPHYNYAGVDIINSPGTPIRASAPGKVITAGYHGGGYGNYIKIQHPNNTVTLYAHLQSFAVSNGDHVDRGQQIGSMGHTGFTIPHNADHLHYEVHGAQNPLK